MQNLITLPPAIKAKLDLFLQDWNRSDLLKDAYSMAYVTLLSLVPSLAVTFALISLFIPFLGENSDLIMRGKSFILSHLATGSGEQVISYLDSFIENVDLKKIGFTGFIGTTASLVLLLHNIEGALNRIFQVEKPRNILTRFIYFWTLITLGTFIIALSVGAISGFEVDSYYSLNEEKSYWAGRLVYIIGIFVFFTLLYKIVPNRPVMTKPAAIGGAFACFLLLAAVQLFGLYADIVKTYQAIYGAALAAVPLFLLWMYVGWLIILLGALVTWRLQQGFNSDDEIIFSELSGPMRDHNEAILKAKLPVLLMVEIYRCFDSKNNKGFDPSQYELESHIPFTWIQSTLDALIEKGLVTETLSTEEEASLRYFPCQAANQLSLATFYELMNAHEIEWTDKISTSRNIPLDKLDRTVCYQDKDFEFSKLVSISN